MKFLENIFLSMVLTVGGMSLVSCTPSYIPLEKQRTLKREIKTRDLFCGVEGLWTLKTGTAMQKMAKDISSKFGIASVAVSGDGRCLIPYIREAKKNGNKVYVAGFSLGDDMIEDVAREAKCGIDGLFLLDGTDAKKIASGVENVVHFRGTVPYLFRGPCYTREHLENPETKLFIITLEGAEHLDVPERAQPYIELIIANGLVKTTK